MKSKKRIERKAAGKAAAALAVLAMMVITMTVVSGCHNASQKETAESVKNGQADTATADTHDETLAKTGTEAQSGAENAQAQDGQAGTQMPPDDKEVSAAHEKPDRKQPPADFELTPASEDWGLSFGEPGTQPRGNALPEDLAWYDAYYVGDDSDKVIYLTFDCGYENGNTEPILDALKKHDVRASFFVVGHFLETAPEMVKRMVEEGHAVGNHTYHHPDMAAISDREAFRKELDDVAELFREITGTELSHYYRPPQGKCNADNLKTAYELGYETIFWSLAYVDWDQDNQPDHEEAIDKLTTRVHPGAVVLLHNTSSTNGEILDELLTKWEEMGYVFKPLSELTADR